MGDVLSDKDIIQALAADLTAARERIAELEGEVAAYRKALDLVASDAIGYAFRSVINDHVTALMARKGKS